MRPVVLIALVALLAVAVTAASNPVRNGQRGQVSAFQKHLRYAWKKMLEYYNWGMKKFNCYVYGTDCPPTKSPSNNSHNGSTQSQHSQDGKGDQFFKLPPSIENFGAPEDDDTKAFTLHTFPTPKRV